MAETLANQAEYPQPSGQEPACGFPIARIVVVFALAYNLFRKAMVLVARPYWMELQHTR